MTDITPSAADCLARVRAILQSGRRQALQTVNAVMVQAYWQIGREIVEEEQRGQDRAAYGTRLIKELAASLTSEFGQGFNARSLWYMKDVYLAFPELGEPDTADPIVNAVRSLLSWTHYRLLARVQRPDARAFYATECAQSRWSTRELERQMAHVQAEFDRVWDLPGQSGQHKLLQHRTFIDLIEHPAILDRKRAIFGAQMQLLQYDLLRQGPRNETFHQHHLNAGQD